MPLEDQDVRKRLEKLMQLDVDAVAVYDHVLKHVHDEDVRKHFVNFQADHRTHAEAHSRMIADLGGEAPDLKPDLTGRMAEWVSGFRARLSDEGPLKAMHTAEEYHVNHYGEAAGWDVAEDIRTRLQSFLADEQRHYAYVEERLAAMTSA